MLTPLSTVDKVTHVLVWSKIYCLIKKWVEFWLNFTIGMINGMKWYIVLEMLNMTIRESAMSKKGYGVSKKVVKTLKMSSALEDPALQQLITIKKWEKSNGQSLPEVADDVSILVRIYHVIFEMFWAENCGK